MQKNRIFSGLGAAAMLAGAGIVAWFDPSQESFFPVCPLYKTTSLACPGCGMTRALHALLNGDIAAAFDFNLMFPVMAFLLGYIFFSLSLMAWRGKGLDFSVFGPKVTWSLFAVAMLFAVARNIPAWPFTVLYP